MNTLNRIFSFLAPVFGTLLVLPAMFNRLPARQRTWIYTFSIPVVLLLMILFIKSMFGLLFAIALVVSCTYLIDNPATITVQGQVFNLNGLRGIFQILRGIATFCVAFILINWWVSRYVEHDVIHTADLKDNKIEFKYGIRTYVITRKNKKIAISGQDDCTDIWEQQGDAPMKAKQYQDTLWVYNPETKNTEAQARAQIGEYVVNTVDNSDLKIDVYYIHKHKFEHIYLWWHNTFSNVPRPLTMD